MLKRAAVFKDCQLVYVFLYGCFSSKTVDLWNVPELVNQNQTKS